MAYNRLSELIINGGIILSYYIYKGLKVTEPERWYSVEEIASYLGVSKEAIYRWVEKEKIPTHKVRQWKFRVSEVDKWITNGNADERGEKR